MRNEFKSYLPMSQTKIQEMWSDCLFVLDTNALLDLYRLSTSSRNQYLTLLKVLSGRIWIPHQVGLEFMRNRHDVISSQVKIFRKAKELIEKLRKDIDASIQSSLNFRIHPSLDKTQIDLQLKAPLNSLESQINSLEKSHPDFLLKDDILEEVLNLFEGKVGPPYTLEDQDRVKKEGQVRYSNEVPPGFKDKKFGDLILWLQTIEKAKADHVKAVILVTSDSKDDWWLTSHGRTIGPLPELREEMQKKASADFHMYSLERFMVYAQAHVMKELSNTTIDEVRDLEDSHKRNERRLAAAEKIKEVLLTNPGIRTNSKFVEDFSLEYEVLKSKIAEQMADIESAELASSDATDSDEAAAWQMYLLHKKGELEKQMKTLTKLVQYLGKPQPPDNRRGS